MDHPIRLVVTDDLKRSRLTVFFRLLLAIPHFVWIYLWSIAAIFALIAAWFAALFTRRVPNGLHNFLAGYLRYQTHLFAYLLIATNPYPPFSSSDPYPITVEIAPPAEQGRLSVFFRFLLALPAAIASGALNYISMVVAIFAWVIAIVLGRIPEGMRNLLAWSIRFHAQTQAYQLLLTARYPSFNVPLEG